MSPSLVTRTPVAQQFHAPEVRDLGMDLSRDETWLGLACGGSPRVDFGTVMSHLLVGATVGSPRLHAGEGDGGRKRRRTGEQEEPHSPTYNRSRPHEATMMLPTTAPTGLSGYPSCDPQRERSREHHKETSGSNIRGGGPERRSRGGDGSRPARASSPRNHVPGSGRCSASQSLDSSDPYGSSSGTVRVEAAMGAIMAGVEVEDMGMEEDTGMAEDIIDTIDPVASRCLAAYPSTNVMAKSLFVCGCTKWCTTLP